MNFSDFAEKITGTKLSAYQKVFMDKVASGQTPKVGPIVLARGYGKRSIIHFYDEFFNQNKEEIKMSKKAFISQPMRGKTPEFIKEEREKMIAIIKEQYPDIEILDTYFKDYDGNAVGFLGKSIIKLSEADIAAFAPGWEEFRGCTVEHMICEKYDIPIIMD